MSKRLLVLLGFVGAAALAGPDDRAPIDYRHGVSMFGELKYPPDYSHFDYLNPDAPKGGALVMSHMAGFDTFAPLAATGAQAPGSGLTLDRLLMMPGDELSVYYGYLAEGLALGEDRRSIAFRLRRETRWHDGVPITSGDVAYTVRKIQSNPLAARLPDVLGWIASVEVRNDREFVLHTHAEVTNANFVILNFMTILPAHYWQDRDPMVADLVPHLGSGPYRVTDFETGRYVRYERVPDYWGRDIPPNRGRYNFDTLRYELYRDGTVAREAFRKGLFDFWIERDLRHWVSSYDTPARAKGWLVQGKYYLRIEIGVRLMLSWNNRRAPFDDRRVRQALTYAFDFDWQNRTLHWGLHERAESHFPDTPFAATGLPDAAELALLEPFRDILPPEVFTEPFTLPRSTGEGRNRANLARARALLAEAGWRIRDGALVNGAGEPFEIEFLSRSAADQRTLLPYIDSLAKLGIGGTIRTVDNTEYIHRRKNLDFQASLRNHDILLPPIIELKGFFHSAAVNMPLTRNLAGISHPAVDALVEAATEATSFETMQVACRALDRVLLWGYYQLPLDAVADPFLAYWDKFGRPAGALDAKYISPFPHGWWYDAEKAARIEFSN